MPVQITRGQAADLPDIVRLNGVVQDLHAALSPEIFRSDWQYSELETCWRGRLRDREGTVLLARLGGEAVGYVWFEVQDRPQDALHLQRRRIYVHHIAVDPGARRARVGGLLLEAVEAEAARLGMASIMLDAWAANSAAQAFFGARGYGVVSMGLGKTAVERGADGA